MDKDMGRTEKNQEESQVITKELLETAIRSKEGRHDITVKTFTIEEGGLLVGGYCSVTINVKVTFEVNGTEKVSNMFIKTAHNNELMKQYLLEECKLFAKENIAYTRIVPDMIRYQTDHGLKLLGPSLPSYFHSIVDDSSGIIILENIRSEGYIIPDKITGLDFEQCKLVMKELAIFHALSFAITRSRNSNMDRYEYLFHESLFPLQTFMTKTLEASVGMVERLSDDPKIREHVRRLLTLDLEKTLKDLLKPVEPYAIICHGDLWCNNLLFKYKQGVENGKPLHVKMIDLQVVRYALPTTDLSYFFYTSTTKTMRRKHLGDLLHLYHSTFLETIDKLELSFPEFTFSMLEKLFSESVMFGVLNMCMYLPSVLLDPVSLDSVQTGGDLDNVVIEQCKQMEGDKEYIHIIKERLIGAVEDAMEFGVL